VLISVAHLYSPLFPTSSFLVLIGLILNYMFLKIRLLKFHKLPPQFSADLVQSAASFLIPLVILTAVLLLYMSSAIFVFSEDPENQVMKNYDISAMRYIILLYIIFVGPLFFFLPYLSRCFDWCSSSKTKPEETTFSAIQSSFSYHYD